MYPSHFSFAQSQLGPATGTLDCVRRARAEGYRHRFNYDTGAENAQTNNRGIFDLSPYL